MRHASTVRFLKELRRRRVLRVAGLYVVAIWLVMQIADIVFPAWGIPDAAIRYLLWAGLLGFPVALAFGWIFQLTPEGIRRTRPEWSEAELDAALPLQRTDYLILSVFLVVIGWIGYDAISRVVRTTPVDEWRPSLAEVVENSVAVLPFASLSGDPEHEYFADGISEEILNRLSAINELKVIARTSSFAFKDSGYDIGRISGLLGVKYLLQGSVRRDGPQLRIAAQLVDRSGIQVWSDTFDRQLGAIFALQEEIAEAVATSIAPQIVLRRHEDRPPDFEAYHHYVIGREQLIRRPANYPQLALEQLDRAIELDADFAAAYAERAAALILGARWFEDRQQQLDRAQRDIDSALARDPGLAQAYAAQALLQQLREPDAHAAREALLRRALALDPNMVNTLNWLAATVSAQGRSDETQELLERAARIDPLATVINVNLARGEATRGRFEEAERRLRRLLEVPQPSPSVLIQLIELHIWTGRLPEALELARRLVLMHVAQEGRPKGQLWQLPIYGTLGMWEQVEFWHTREESALPDSVDARLGRARAGLEVAYPGYAEAASAFRETLEAAGVDISELPHWHTLNYGTLLALAGDYRRAIEILETVINPEVSLQAIAFGQEANARHGLAWAWLRTGETEKARAMLLLFDELQKQRQAGGQLHLGSDRFDYARNTLLLGDKQGALDLLEQAEQAGWRGYYAILRDPRWDSVRDEPRFQAIMARVKADIDRQRARVEQMDAEVDFIARLEAALALKAAEDALK